jgi:LmbE family N-acetylglucosaminyl deacetylase
MYAENEMAKHTLLYLGAHPDDETTLAPLLGKAVKDGHRVHIVTITSGQRGVRPHFGMEAGEALGEIRAEEFRASVRTLGATQAWLLGYQDGAIAALDPFWDIVGSVRRVVNEVKPDVIVTFGPDGLTGHLDHRTASEVATIVFQRRWLLECEPKKLYYYGFPESVFGGDANPINRKRDFLLVSDQFITTVVDCSDVAENSLRSLECHKSQWRPERMEQLKYVYRDLMRGRVYLRLALTTLPWPSKRERDIFEGLD